MAARLRWAIALDLALFNLAVFALAVIPPSTLILPEAIAMVVSSFCFVGVLTHASTRVHLPGEQWSALGTAWVGTITMLGYLLSADAYITYEVAVPLFLLAGTASAFAAHLLDGAIPNLPRHRDGHRDQRSPLDDHGPGRA